jgi:hypothetical protein
MNNPATGICALGDANMQDPRHSEVDKSMPKASFFDRLIGIATLSEIVRIFGACAVLASMSLFLLEGWNEGNDIQRYFKLLAQTGLLTGAGFALSYFLKENKGARFFFGLSLVSVVSSFTILGSLIYSLFQWDGQLIEYPEVLTWQAIDLTTFMPICAGAIVLLSLLSSFSFRVFSRNIAGSLTLNFLLMNSLLLIPVRGSLSISVLAAAVFWVCSMTVKRLSQKDRINFTKETKFSLALLFLPGIIIIARALSLYNVDEVMLIALCGLAYFALRSWLIRLEQASFGKRLMELTQLVLVVVIAVQSVSLLPSSLSDTLPALFSMIVAAFSYDQIGRSCDTRWRSFVLNLSVVSLVLLNIAFAMLEPALIIQLMSFGVTAFMLGFVKHTKPLVSGSTFAKNSAIMGCAVSLLLVALELVSLAQLSTWMVVGLIGMLLIIGASFYERFGLSLWSKAN